MARKKFRFDFNEDAEPVEELHRRRVAMMEHFKTIEAIGGYLRTVPAPEELLAQPAAAEGKTSLKAVRRKAKSSAKPRGKRKSASRPIHT